ncbi:HAD family hydrolase [Sporanaerobacter acetigenes]|uniref:HAD family hydrolase n=1 Tax=Sporanaerobacter acetigenes TaxID=165813 RepID=UPI0033228B7D
MKGIIFDMDGVIVDSEPLHFKLEKEILEEFGGAIDRKEHESFVGTTDYKMWGIFKERFNLEPSIEELVELKKKRFQQNIDKIQLMDNILDFIKFLQYKGYILALASSNNKKTVDLIVDNFKLDKYFKVIISGEEVLNGKPDPEIFLKAASAMNLKPEDCLVIEDATNGIIAAKAAGMKCIAIRNKNSGNQDLSEADTIIDNFKELF